MNLLQETTAKVKKLQGQFFLTFDKSVPRTALARLEETVDSVIELVPVVEGGRTFSELRIKRMRDRKSTRLNSSHIQKSRMPSSA